MRLTGCVVVPVVLIAFRSSWQFLQSLRLCRAKWRNPCCRVWLVWKGCSRDILLWSSRCPTYTDPINPGMIAGPYVIRPFPEIYCPRTPFPVQSPPSNILCTQVSRTVAQVARHISHTPQGTSRTSLLVCQPCPPPRKQPRDSAQEVAHVRSRAEEAGQADSQNGKDRGAMLGRGPFFTHFHMYWLARCNTRDLRTRRC